MNHWSTQPWCVFHFSSEPKLDLTSGLWFLLLSMNMKPVKGPNNVAIDFLTLLNSVSVVSQQRKESAIATFDLWCPTDLKLVSDWRLRTDCFHYLRMISVNLLGNSLTSLYEEMELNETGASFHLKSLNPTVFDVVVCFECVFCSYFNIWYLKSCSRKLLILF